MKPAVCLLLLVSLLLPSCISSALATAAIAGGGLTTAAGTGISSVAGTGLTSSLPSMSSLLGKNAPKAADLEGHSFAYKGEVRGVDNVPTPAEGSIAFGKANPAIEAQEDGSSRVTQYSREDDKKAVITITTAAGVESYRLTFSDAKEGSYVYERRHGADFATGEGSFTIQ